MGGFIVFLFYVYRHSGVANAASQNITPTPAADVKPLTDAPGTGTLTNRNSSHASNLQPICGPIVFTFNIKLPVLKKIVVAVPTFSGYYSSICSTRTFLPLQSQKKIAWCFR
jgi:hypothetical protein